MFEGLVVNFPDTNNTVHDIGRCELLAQNKLVIAQFLYTLFLFTTEATVFEMSTVIDGGVYRCCRPSTSITHIESISLKKAINAKCCVSMK